MRKRNLVYIIGLSERIATEKTLSEDPYLGQYGPIRKVIVNTNSPFQRQTHSSYSAYVTYEQEADAAFAIIGLDGFEFDGNILRASFGMTKYCSFFLRKLQCQSQDCLFLHKFAKKEDEFKKDDANTIRFTTKSDLECLVRHIESNYKDTLRARMKEKVTFTPVLGSMAFVLDFISKQSALTNGGPADVSKLKVSKSTKPRKAATQAASQRVKRWDDNSDTETQTADRSTADSQINIDPCFSHIMTSSTSTNSTGELDLLTKPSSPSRSHGVAEGSCSQISRPSKLSRSPTVRKISTPIARKISKSNERKIDTENCTERKVLKDFTPSFLETHRSLFEQVQPLLDDPLRRVPFDSLAQTQLDKLLLKKVNREFYILGNRTESMFKFASRPELFEDYDAPQKPNIAKSMLGQYLNLPNDAFAPPPEPCFTLFAQTYEVKRFK